MSRSRVVHVDIHGQRYAVRSDLEPTYVVELAAFVDQKMRLAANELQSGDAVRTAVVAALNIADELFRRRAEAPNLEERVVARTAEIERLIDLALDEAKAPDGRIPAAKRETA